jgi:hypothetical protein
MAPKPKYKKKSEKRKVLFATDCNVGWAPKSITQLSITNCLLTKVRF